MKTMMNIESGYDAKQFNYRKEKPDPTRVPNHALSACEEEYEDAPINRGLLTKRRMSIRDRIGTLNSQEWMRPYWLGASLFLILFAFWLLDSMKDPLFARLVDGNLDKHQPPAKLFSVFTTLILVCVMEYLANIRQQAESEQQRIRPQEDILDPGGIWTEMSMARRHGNHALDDTVSVSIFTQLGIPYAIVFAMLAYVVRQFDAMEELALDSKENVDTNNSHESEAEGLNLWYILAYALYATVESFGSLAVATFWSYANSTLSLDDAERYYGPIIAIAQLGAIGGSTMVASDHWDVPSLLVVVSLLIVLQIILMQAYYRRFKPTSLLLNEDDNASVLTWQDDDVTLTKPFWSGLYLIIRHNYVLLILGVSCLYEISLTCLDYQMKLLGWKRFETEADGDDDMSFSKFMGRYGQVVNITSLLFSSMIFPWLISRYGLRITLRMFPTMLLIVTVIAYGALPGNLTVLFFSLSILKAMTYSVHDPSKEILYIPTSNAVKFRAKFWIDVVGERISKAVGSGFNTFAGSVDRSVKIGGIPSLVSAIGLWAVCYFVGIEFDRLLATGKIVGLEKSVDPATYKRVTQNDEQAQERAPEPSEIEIQFQNGNSSSTLGFSRYHLDASESEYDEDDMTDGSPSLVHA